MSPNNLRTERMDDTASVYFRTPLSSADPDVAALVASERNRQHQHIELIASENVVSRAVMEAQGSIFSNKTVEGYPGARYHGGAEIADALETLGSQRACKLFNAAEVNLQPHSGSQANLAVFSALLEPFDSVLALDLKSGGHLSHGAKANISGKLFTIHTYGLRPDSGFIDLDKLADMARANRPKLIIAGGSSYPRALDLKAFRQIADDVGAYLLVDMAHFAGLVAGGVLDNPVEFADVVTTTTYKSLRGARGGMILWNRDDLSRSLRSAVFPGVQGSPLLNMLAAKTVGLGEALQPSFRQYAEQVQRNARALAGQLSADGLSVVTGGTDTPLMLVDLMNLDMDGQTASDKLAAIGITCNKNLIPNDSRSPATTSGLRLGVSAMTSRGMVEADARQIGSWIADCLLGRTVSPQAVRRDVKAMASGFDFY
ncbi:serine hydroxymethyltransferase [Limibacillus halophilus]|uniref:Probable serine hydroxymethyltransferase n=1 Tax=Limibacillus halophilus TaxID=1579333 RepID=A0A839SPS4_9PROT|nr:serine hydroxymethyltransferase [Limibacillus halophilus]MBB3063750.1 glycine hydroxymethyltransferase [Limibacillus halophilus]